MFKQFSSKNWSSREQKKPACHCNKCVVKIEVWGSSPTIKLELIPNPEYQANLGPLCTAMIWDLGGGPSYKTLVLALSPKSCFSVNICPVFYVEIIDLSKFGTPEADLNFRPVSNIWGWSASQCLTCFSFVVKGQSCLVIISRWARKKVRIDS